MTESTLQNSQHINKSFEDSLNDINTTIINMGAMVADLIEFARKSLDKDSVELVKEARTLDKKLNALDFEVQQKATTMIALRQPMGVDLRFLVASLKMSSSLERMGDLAKSSVRKAARFHEIISPEIAADLKEMTALAGKMLGDTMLAFRDMSIEKANDILDQDDDVDDLYHDLLKDVEKHIAKNKDMIPHFADIIFAAKNMERLGDHCTKLADLVHYISSGEHVGKLGAQAKEASQA